LTQALAELPHQWGLLVNAFVNNNPFYAEHEWTRRSLQRRSVVHARHRPSYSVDVFDATIPRLWQSLPGRDLMIFRARFALNTVGSLVNGLTPCSPLSLSSPGNS